MNPYNHHQPVTSSERFVGREDVIDDINYDLKLALSQEPQFINIGITGKEGAGKTSLSYIMEEEAKSLGFKAVRLKIDKAIVKNEVKFFERLYQSITSEVGGKTESGFLKALGGAVDQVEINLKFIKAYMNTKDNPDVSDQIVYDDLETLSDKIDTVGMLIIIDNAQHLSNNPILLQKLNNIFENIDKYILSLVGTEEMFSSIENAFSPTARMFDKHRLEPFTSYTDTAQCILKPLQNIEDPPKISKQTISEVHHLTGGRPYEINLTLFHMYKVHQEESTNLLKLSPDVIGKVTDQMEEWRRPVNNELPDEIKDLDQTSLKLLRSILETEPIHKQDLVNYHLVANLPNLTEDSIERSREKLISSFSKLSESDIIDENKEKISLNGGIYLDTFIKYYLYSEKILPVLDKTYSIQEVELYPSIHYRLIDNDILSELTETHSHFTLMDYQSDPRYLDQLKTKSLHEDPHIDVVDKKDQFDIEDSLVLNNSSNDLVITQQDYRSQIRESSIGKNSSEAAYPPGKRLTVTLEIEWLDSKYRIIFHSNSQEEIEEVEDRLQDKEAKLQRLGIEIGWENQYVLCEKASRKLDQGDLEKALELSEKAIELSNGYDPFAWEIQATAQIIQEEYEQALTSINESISILEENADARLTKSEILIQLERIDDAISEFEEVVQLDPENPDLWAKICHQLCQVSEYTEARKWGKRGIERSGGNSHLKTHLAESEWMHENYEEAIKYASEIVSSDKEWRERNRLWSLLGHCFLNVGKEEIGRKHIHRISDESSKAYSLGWIETRCGNEELAKSHLSKAVEEDPTILEKINMEDELPDVDG